MRSILEKLTLFLLPILVYLIIRFLELTVRFSQVGRDEAAEILEGEDNFILAFWHGRLLMISYIYRLYRPGTRLQVLISQHRDGEIISRAMRYFGHRSVRGSSTRGGIGAMREMLKVLKDGFDSVVTPDGPKGPKFKVQRGVVELARMTGIPVVPVAFSARSKWQLKSWDAFLIPRPFTRGVFWWGKPLKYPDSNDKESIEEFRIMLERELNSITEKADGFFEP